MQLTELFPLARDSVGDPRGAFRRLLNLNLGPDALWPAFFVITALSVILVEVSIRLDAGAPDAAYLSAPFLTAAVLASSMMLLALGVYFGGRLLGGTGNFAGAMLAVIWQQFVVACLQVAQLMALLLVPFLAGLFGLAEVVLSFWLLTGFVAELHGFRSRPRVFAGIVIGLLGCSAVLLFVLALLGVPLTEFVNV